MGDTKINWADKVWNPVTGCTKVSEGCRHCYAERMAKRLAGRYGYPEAPDQFKVTLHPDKLDEPLHWKKPARIFVDSMGDLFHEDVPDWFIREVFWTMQRCGWHTFIILTKRPERMQKWLTKDPLTPVLPNVWLGVSVEDQKTADERIPLLLRTPAVVRFVSVEPMLGPVDLFSIFSEFERNWEEVGSWSRENPYYLHWVICGGGTGPGARPLQPEWAESLLSQCQAAGVPFFFKQWGEWSDTRVINGKHTMTRIGRNKAGRYLCGRTWDEYPEGRKGGI